MSPSINSTSLSAYQSFGRSQTEPLGSVPASSPFDSGGRSYGRTGSAQTIVIGSS